jgi:hypothetical protein
MVNVKNVSQEEFLATVNCRAGIWLNDVGVKPYHLGFSAHQRYFSLKFRSKDVNLNVESVLQKLAFKNKKAVFIPLMVDYSLEHAQKSFNKFQSCLIDECSCIEPILELVRLTGDKWILFDLIMALEQAGQVDQAIGINIPSEFQLETYTYKEVEKNLCLAQPK